MGNATLTGHLRSRIESWRLLWRAGRVALWALALAWLLSGLRASADTVIKLRESVEIGAKRIQLGALAEVTAPAEEAEALAALDMGPAPLPGRSRVLSLGYVKMRMRRWGLDPGAARFTGSPEVRVSCAPPAGPSAEPIVHEGASEATPATPPTPPVVKCGARVQLAVIRGAVCILAEATTLEDGVVGRPVRMRVEQTRQTLWATLLSATQATLTP